MILDRDSWQEIGQALSKNKVRTMLTAFGVFWGMFMLLIMLGSGKGLENGVSKDFGSMATNSFFLWSQRTSIPYKGLPKNRSFSLKNDDTKAIKDIEGVAVVAPRNQLGGWKGSNTVSRNGYTETFSVMGDVPDLLKINPKRIIKGRFLNPIDVEEKRKVAIIGSRVADVLFDPEEEPIGENIEISGVFYTVAGIFGNVDEASADEGDLETIYVPISTMQQAYNMGDRVAWFSIMAAPGVLCSELQQKVKKVLADRHRVHPEDPRAFGSHNLEERFLTMQNLFMGIRFLIWLVGIGTLSAGVIGVSNIMLVVVKERTKEIGIRKALGATPFYIVSQIMLEALALTAAAGYLGLLAGTYSIELLASQMEGAEAQMFANPEINFEVAIIALIVLIISGALAGLIPASRAARINPVYALKSEG